MTRSFNQPKITPQSSMLRRRPVQMPEAENVRQITRKSQNLYCIRKSRRWIHSNSKLIHIVPHLVQPEEQALFFFCVSLCAQCARPVLQVIISGQKQWVYKNKIHFPFLPNDMITNTESRLTNSIIIISFCVDLCMRLFLLVYSWLGGFNCSLE